MTNLNVLQARLISRLTRIQHDLVASRHAIINEHYGIAGRELDTVYDLLDALRDDVFDVQQETSDSPDDFMEGEGEYRDDG